MPAPVSFRKHVPARSTPRRSAWITGPAAALGLVAAATAQDVALSVAPSDTSVPAGSAVTIDLAFTNSDAPNTGIASIDVALQVNGPGQPVVVGQPVFPDNWPVAFGQLQFDIVPDGAGGFSRITALRFGPGTTPVVNPPVLFTYDVLLPAVGVYTFTLAPGSSVPAVRVADAVNCPVEPASTALNPATVTVGAGGGCAPLTGYTLDATLAFETTAGVNGDERSWAVAIDADAIDPALAEFDVVVRDPFGNAFDPGDADGPRLTFDTQAAFLDYVANAFAATGWSIGFTAPDLAATPQVFPVSFAVDQPALDAFAAEVAELEVVAPLPGVNVGRTNITLAWSPDPVPAPAGLIPTGAASADPASGATATVSGLSPDAGSTTFPGPFNVGAMDLAVTYATDPGDFAPLGLISLSVDAPCSASGLAEITAAALQGQAVTTAGTEVTVVLNPACSVADLEPTFGILDLADIDAFINAFLNAEPAADLAPTFGIYDLADIDVFINAFLDGCP